MEKTVGHMKPYNKRVLQDSLIIELHVGEIWKDLSKIIKQMGLLKAEFPGFCSHTFNSSYCQDLNSINFVKSPFTFFNNFANTLKLWH